MERPTIDAQREARSLLRYDCNTVMKMVHDQEVERLRAVAESLLARFPKTLRRTRIGDLLKASQVNDDVAAFLKELRAYASPK